MGPVVFGGTPHRERGTLWHGTECSSTPVAAPAAAPAPRPARTTPVWPPPTTPGGAAPRSPAPYGGRGHRAHRPGHGEVRLLLPAPRGRHEACLRGQLPRQGARLRRPRGFPRATSAWPWPRRARPPTTCPAPASTTSPTRACPPICCPCCTRAWPLTRAPVNERRREHV